MVDFLKRRGYRFKGAAELRPPGDEAFEWLLGWLLDTHGPGYPAHEAVLVRVEHVLPVESPAYTIGHASEADLVGSWAAAYGVGPARHTRGQSSASP